jgi:hypothetical protein
MKYIILIIAVVTLNLSLTISDSKNEVIELLIKSYINEARDLVIKLDSISEYYQLSKTPFQEQLTTLKKDKSLLITKNKNNVIILSAGLTDWQGGIIVLKQKDFKSRSKTLLDYRKDILLGSSIEHEIAFSLVEYEHTLGISIGIMRVLDNDVRYVTNLGICFDLGADLKKVDNMLDKQYIIAEAKEYLVSKEFELFLKTSIN